MTWRCDSAAVSAWVDKKRCCWWQTEFAVQQQRQVERYACLAKYSLDAANREDYRRKEEKRKDAH